MDIGHSIKVVQKKRAKDHDSAFLEKVESEIVFFSTSDLALKKLVLTPKC